MGRPSDPDFGSSPKPSIEFPVTLKSLPYTSSPVGIFIGLPVDITLVPLDKPSVESIETVLTMFSPM